MELEERIEEVKARMAAAAARANRPAEAIQLIAVTKTWPAEVVLAAFEAGLHDFGENRAEELAEKRVAVESRLGSEAAIRWHAIGALQSRKTDLVADQADVFQALDRLKIAQRLARRLQENGRSETRPLPIFLEVNVSGEGSKAGIDCSQWEKDGRQRDSLVALAAEVGELPGLRPQGLMTMAPWQVDEGIIRRVFARTRELAAWLQGQLPAYHWSELSLGMSDDFEIAIEEGATYVRVGRAIFGERS